MKIEVMLKVEILDLFFGVISTMSIDDILQGLRSTIPTVPPISQIIKACEVLVTEHMLEPVPGSINKWAITTEGETRVYMIHEAMKLAARNMAA